MSGISLSLTSSQPHDKVQKKNTLPQKSVNFTQQKCDLNILRRSYFENIYFF